MTTTPRTIAIFAGEASGDLHASHLIRALRQRLGHCRVWGMGGHEMRAAGADIVENADQLSVVGVTEVFAKASRLFKARSHLKHLLLTARPDLLILLDFPDFNLHMAAHAKRLDIPVLYYISPQIWAWRAGRVKKIKARVDHMAVILPFEKAFYEKHGVPVSFVGHPLMDSVAASLPTRKDAPGDGNPPVVGLLAGSRDREVRTLLPRMLLAGQLLQKRMGKIQFRVSCASSIDIDVIRDILSRHPVADVQMTREPVGALLPKCHLAIVASGTVTLEGALYATPMIITYCLSPLSYWMGRMLINVEHIGLVNLIAQRRIVPELVQRQASPGAICEAAQAILSNPKTYADMCSHLVEVRSRLGVAGASHHVAKIACTLMGCDNAV